MNRRMRALAAVPAIALLSVTASCGRSQTPQTIQITLVTKALDSEWWQRVKAGAEEDRKSVV